VAVLVWQAPESGCLSAGQSFE